jgi:hypothetical protein
MIRSAVDKIYPIELGENMPPLGDQRDKNCHNRDLKPKPWVEMGEKLNVSTFSGFRYFNASIADVLCVKGRFTATSVSSPILKTFEGASLI